MSLTSAFGNVTKHVWLVIIVLSICGEVMCNDDVRSAGNALIVRADDVEHLSDHFKSARRDLYFSGLRVSVLQNWRDVGVAAVVWDAAIVLCDYMVIHPELVQGKSVVEIGAGTGLAGLLAAKLGGSVTLTDRPLALDILQRNLDLNMDLCGEKSAVSHWLNWTFHKKEAYPQTIPCKGLDEVKVKVLSWGENLEAHPQYDVIVAADVVYLEGTFPSLINTFRHLCRQDSIILLSCKIRYARDRRFLSLMRKDFVFEQVVSHPDKGIYLYKARLK